MKKLIVFCLILFQCVVLFSQGIITSPDGKKRVLINPTADGRFQVIVNSSIHNIYQKILKNKIYFVTDSFKVAYIAQCDDGYCMVVEGTEQQHYTEIDKNNIVISPDRSHYAYAALKGNKWLYIIDGVEQNNYNIIPVLGFIFSPNSRRWAYAAIEGNKCFYIIDGVEQPHYREISLRSIAFSPDSKYWAYAARNDKKWFYIIDGIEQPHYNNVFEINLIYKQDSLHWNYSAKKDGRLIYIIDGKETLADNIKYTTSTYHEFSNTSKFFIKTGYGLSRSSSVTFLTGMGSGLLYLATKEEFFNDGFSTLIGLSIISSLSGPLFSCIGVSMSDFHIKDYNYWKNYRNLFLAYSIGGIAIPLVLIKTDALGGAGTALYFILLANACLLPGLNVISKTIHRQFLFHNKLRDCLNFNFYID